MALACLPLAGLAAWSANGAPHPAWTLVRSPYFTVVSDAGWQQTEDAARTLEEAAGVFRAVIPGAREHDIPPATVLALRNIGAFRDLVPEFWQDHRAHDDGLAFRSGDSLFVAVRLDSSKQAVKETLYHEYFHVLCSSYRSTLPLWLSEGLAGFYSTAQVAGRDIVLGKPNLAQVAELRAYPLIPLAELVRATPASHYYVDDDKAPVFYAESWALAHFLMLGGGGSRRSALEAYLAQPGNQQAAAAGLLGDLATVDKAFAAYLRDAQFPSRAVRSAVTFASGPYPARPIGEPEADAMRAEFELHRGEPDLARAFARNALRLDPNLRAAREALQSLDQASSPAGSQQEPSLTRAVQAMAGLASATTTVGRIADASCSPAGALQLDVQSTGASLHFEDVQAGTYSLIVPAWANTKGFDACHDLDGHQVQVAYVDDGQTQGQNRLLAVSVLRNPSPPSIGRPAVLSANDDASFDGDVALVACQGKFLSIALQSNPRYALVLWAKNYRNVAFTSGDGPTARAVLRPCSELAGRRVHALYTPVADKNYDGLLRSLTLTGSQKRPPNPPPAAATSHFVR
jgi:hypothetical protein